MIRVALVDDEELVCRYIRQILEGSDPELEVVGYAVDGAEAVGLVTRTRPDVVLLDVRMPGIDGLSTLATIRGLEHPPRVVMLSGFDDDLAVLQALRSGAVGYLLKSTAPRDLAAAVRLAVSGHQVLGEGLTRDRPDPARAGSLSRAAALTSRESDVLRLLGDGWSNAAIAGSLGVTEATVKGHVSAVMAKLGCRSRLQAGLAAHDLWHPGGDRDDSREHRQGANPTSSR